MNSQIANGQAVSIYLAACNDAGLCGAWAGPTAQVIPYGPIANPAVSAVANGTSITYTWSAQSDGLAETLNVCINGGCTNYNVPATGGYNGSSTANSATADGHDHRLPHRHRGPARPGDRHGHRHRDHGGQPDACPSARAAPSQPTRAPARRTATWVDHHVIARLPRELTVNYTCQSSNSGSVLTTNDRDSAGVTCRRRTQRRRLLRHRVQVGLLEQRRAPR